MRRRPARRDPADGAAAAGARTQPRAAVPWQLPAASRLFLGSDEELAWLDRRLGRPGTPGWPRLLLYGPAGAGKSALALTWARRRRDQFPDGQLYADFGSRTAIRALTPAEVLIDFLVALGHIPVRSRRMSQGWRRCSVPRLPTAGCW